MGIAILFDNIVDVDELARSISMCHALQEDIIITNVDHLVHFRIDTAPALE